MRVEIDAEWSLGTQDYRFARYFDDSGEPNGAFIEYRTPSGWKTDGRSAFVHVLRLAARVQELESTCARQLATLRRFASEIVDPREIPSNADDIVDCIRAAWNGTSEWRRAEQKLARDAQVGRIVELEKAAQERGGRLARLDALLASEEPPEGLMKCFGEGKTAPFVAWRWLRDTLRGPVDDPVAMAFACPRCGIATEAPGPCSSCAAEEARVMAGRSAHLSPGETSVHQSSRILDVSGTAAGSALSADAMDRGFIDPGVEGEPVAAIIKDRAVEGLQSDSIPELIDHVMRQHSGQFGRCAFADLERIKELSGRLYHAYDRFELGDKTRPTGNLTEKTVNEINRRLRESIASLDEALAHLRSRA